MSIARGAMSLLDPTLKVESPVTSMAPRPRTLDGLVVGLLDNSKRNANLILDATFKLLSQRYNLAGVVRHGKLTASRPFAPDVIDDVARRCQFAITGVGD